MKEFEMQKIGKKIKKKIGKENKKMVDTERNIIFQTEKLLFENQFHEFEIVKKLLVVK